MTLTRITSDGITDGTVVNADINASAAIAGSKITPIFTSNLTVSANSAIATISATNASNTSVSTLLYKNRDGNSNLRDIASIEGESTGNGGYGALAFHTAFNNSLVEQMRIGQDGQVDFTGNVDCNSGLDVTGAITGTGDLTIDTNTLHVDSSNNRVGIGTTSPINTLHIKANAPAIRFEDNDANGSAVSIIEDVDGFFKIRNDAGNAGSGSGIGFEVDASEKMRIDSSGKVGIGTTSPNNLLNIHGVFETNAFDNSNGQGGRFTAKGLLIGDAFTAGKTSSDDRNSIIWNERGLDIVFATNDTERMKIDSSGKVGIKTSSPIGTLDVHDGTFCLTKPSGDASSRNWRFVADNGAAGNLGIQVSTASGGTTFSNVFEIDSSGNVGIVNSSPTQWGGGIPTIEFKGTAHNSRGGAIAFESHSGSSGYNVIYSDNGDLRIYAGSGNRNSATEKVMFPNSGGITFNGDTAAANALDDYEEGTFTPTNTIGLTLTNNTTAHYTKVGRVVHIQIDCTFSGSADTSICGIIQGLPFTSKSGCVNEGSLQFYSNTNNAKLDESDDNTRIFIGASESRIDIQNITTGSFQTRAFMVGRRFRIQMNYLTA